MESQVGRLICGKEGNKIIIFIFLSFSAESVRLDDDRFDEDQGGCTC